MPDIFAIIALFISAIALIFVYRQYQYSQIKRIGVLTTNTTIDPKVYPAGTLFEINQNGIDVSLPNPQTYPGLSYTLWHNQFVGAGTNTISTPSGAFYGTTGSGNSMQVMNPNEKLVVQSDGTNWIVL